MATGSGLDAQFGFVTEPSWATETTVTKFAEFDAETLKFDPTWLEPTGLRVGTKYKRAARVRQSRTSVSGDFTVEHATKNMGTFWKHALGSTITTPTQIGTTTAYKQIHTPGDHRGLGMTMQVGRPEPGTGTVRPFTFAGCKVTQWDFDLKENAIPSLKLAIDGKLEDTAAALATASFLSGATVFDFSQAQILLGGTASTASGETTVTGGVAMTTIVNEFSLSGKVPMKVDRFGIGNAGQKAEQLENATPTITGKLAAEFGKTELYDVFKANTTIVMQFILTGGAIGSSGSNYLLSFVMPAVKLKAAPPNVSGPDIVMMSTDFEVYSDEVNPVFQTKIVSDESTL
jgi:hypothetical protein